MDNLWALALSCLRVGTFVFGGGLVFIPLMQADVVDRYGWLSQREFVDAVALGQMTPGPVLVTATFIGYKVAGLLGACVATICIFLPSFVMTILAARIVSRLRKNKRLQDFLWGVRAAIVGLIAAALAQLARTGLASFLQIVLCIGALWALCKFRLHGGLVIVLCGLVGLLWTRGFSSFGF